MTNHIPSVAITGGASGLGKALALRYAAAGWRVAIADIHNERGYETLSELNKITEHARYDYVDVRHTEQIQHWRDDLFKHWNGIDIVINNAGVATHGGIAESTLDDWDWVIDINLKGVARGCKLFSEAFKQRGYGHIVNIASMAGLIHSPEMASYNAVKAAVVAISETMRFELEPFGIHTTVVCPGFFQTNLAESTRSPDQNAKAHVKKMLATSNLNSEEIANMIFEGINNKDFMVLPHKNYRRIWQIKRFLPTIYARKMAALGKKIASTRR